MKILKRIFVIFIISLMSITFRCSNSYGEVATGLSIEIYEKVSNANDTAVDTDEIKSDFLSYYGYSDELKTGDKAMKLVTTISVVRRGSAGNYWIYIGNCEIELGANGRATSTKGISFENLQEQWACTYSQDDIDKELDEGSGSISWNVVLLCTFTEEQVTGVTNWVAYLRVNEVYSGDDYDDATEIETTGTEVADYTSVVNIDDSNSNGLTWVRKFVTNPIGTFTNVILDVIKEIADAVQMLINLIQTVPLGVYDDWTVKYTAGTLENEGEDGKRNKYTNVKKYYNEDNDTENNDTEINEAYEADDSKLSVLIADDEADDYLFEDTKIPITYVDFYTMALNKVSVLDINFLTVDKSLHDDDSVWKTLRDFVASFVLLAFYIAAILLITALIWMGVQIVTNTVNPYTRAKNKEGLQRLIKGVIMLVGTLLIMALSIFSYQAVLGDVYDEDSYELPIRVYFYQNWSGWFGLAGSFNASYSFSTSFTGYIRFMAEIENPDRCMQKAGYVIAYVVLVIMNVIVLIIMLIRTLVMWVLSIVGPILAAIYAITENQKVMNWYKSWAFVYIVFALIQVIFAIVCVVLLNVMEFSSLDLS